MRVNFGSNLFGILDGEGIPFSMGSEDHCQPIWDDFSNVWKWSGTGS